MKNINKDRTEAEEDKLYEELDALQKKIKEDENTISSEEKIEGKEETFAEYRRNIEKPGYTSMYYYASEEKHNEYQKIHDELY